MDLSSVSPRISPPTTGARGTIGRPWDPDPDGLHRDLHRRTRSDFTKRSASRKQGGCRAGRAAVVSRRRARCSCDSPTARCTSSRRGGHRHDTLRRLLRHVRRHPRRRHERAVDRQSQPRRDGQRHRVDYLPRAACAAAALTGLTTIERDPCCSRRARVFGDNINTDYIIASTRRADARRVGARATCRRRSTRRSPRPSRPGDLLRPGAFGCGSAMEVAATVILAAGICA